MKKQTITFPDEIEDGIESWRKAQTKIPYFQDAVLALITKGLRDKTLPASAPSSSASSMDILKKSTPKKLATLTTATERLGAVLA